MTSFPTCSSTSAASAPSRPSRLARRTWTPRRPLRANKDGYFDIAMRHGPRRRRTSTPGRGHAGVRQQRTLAAGQHEAPGCHAVDPAGLPRQALRLGPRTRREEGIRRGPGRDGQGRPPPGRRRWALPHTVGYWDKPGNRDIDNFVGVVTPKSLDQEVVYPKEQTLIDICKKQKKDGIQTWVLRQHDPASGTSSPGSRCFWNARGSGSASCGPRTSSRSTVSGGSPSTAASTTS